VTVDGSRVDVGIPAFCDSQVVPPSVDFWTMPKLLASHPVVDVVKKTVRIGFVPAPSAWAFQLVPPSVVLRSWPLLPATQTMEALTPRTVSSP
jgi:hypothetical protein